MFELYRYAKGSGKPSRHAHVFLSADAARNAARAHERRRPGRTALYEIIDAAAGRVIWHGHPETGWQRGEDPDRSEPW